MSLKGKLLFIDPGSRFIRMGVLDFHSDGAPDLVFVNSYESKGINNGSVSSRGELSDSLRKCNSALLTDGHVYPLLSEGLSLV